MNFSLEFPTAVFRKSLFGITVMGCLLSSALPALAQKDLFMRDTPLDVGIEPNPNGGAMYVSDDIWIRNKPDPNYSPAPFSTTAPPWTPQPHENPEYRHSRYAKPNWVYVRVSNRGTTASTGNERLRVYWAKASTGLGWPTQWVDYFDTHSGCSGQLFMGEEITKTRKNLAKLSSAEINSFVNTVKQLDQIAYSGGVSYWDKQDEIHQSTHVHAGPAFLPWHRELINRYENLLREIDPTIKLHYWDWTKDPRQYTGGYTELLDNSSTTSPGAYGQSSGRAGAPFNTFDNNNVCTGSRGSGGCVSNCTGTGNPVDPPMVILRNVSGSPISTSDNSIVSASGTFPAFRVNLEGYHNSSHVYIGGTLGCEHNAFEDPFVYLLHSNVDKIFAKWQRASVSRLDRNLVFGSEASSIEINEDLEPWAGSSGIDPWTPTGGDAIVKNSLDYSVVSPPFYDDAPLTIPVLQPGQSAIIQIPWFAPNPSDYACFGADKGHFCLLARIEETATYPFGMTYQEQSSSNELTSLIPNVRNNNNIVWKNVQIVDLIPGAGMIVKGEGCVIVRGAAERASNMKLQVSLAGGITPALLQDGALKMVLPSNLYDKWVQAGMAGNGVIPVGNQALAITTPGAWIDNIQLEPGQIENVCITVTALAPKLPADIKVNLDQFDNKIPVGGQNFDFILSPVQNLPALRKGQVSLKNATESGFSLSNYPNPFAGETTIAYQLPEDAGKASIEVFDITGRLVNHFELKPLKGKGTVSFSAKALESGIYYYNLVVDGNDMIREKMILTK